MKLQIVRVMKFNKANLLVKFKQSTELLGQYLLPL